jgi:hypothetical protein
VAIAAGDLHRMARGRDLSAQGIGLTVAGAAIVPEEAVETEFALPGFYVPVKIPARVAWADPRSEGLGLRFVEIDADLEELLENYVAGRL